MSNGWQKMKVFRFKLTVILFDKFRRLSSIETKEGLR